MRGLPVKAAVSILVRPVALQPQNSQGVVPTRVSSLQPGAAHSSNACSSHTSCHETDGLAFTGPFANRDNRNVHPICRHGRTRADLVTLTTSTMATLSPVTPPLAHLMPVADFMLARTVAERLEVNSAAAPFAGVQSALNGADLLVGNLECVISDLGQPQPKAYRFRAPLEAAEALAHAGVAVVSQANNRALDYSAQGMLDTRQRLAAVHSATVGA